MIPVLCIVGRKKSGKTLLIERLIPELQALGYRVGTVKHHRHATELDVEGKDSWRHTNAGAEAVAVSSPVQLVVFRQVKAELPLEAVVPLLGEVDLILAEGFKESPLPKVEVHRSALGLGLLSSQGDGLIAVVSDLPLEVGVPCFEWDTIGSLVGFIAHRFLNKGRSSHGKAGEA